MGLFSVFTPSLVAINAVTLYSWEYCVSLWFEWKILTKYPPKWPLVRPITSDTHGCYSLIRPHQDSLFLNAILRAGFPDRKVRYVRCLPLVIPINLITPFQPNLCVSAQGAQLPRWDNCSIWSFDFRSLRLLQLYKHQ